MLLYRALFSACVFYSVWKATLSQLSMAPAHTYTHINTHACIFLCSRLSSSGVCSMEPSALLSNFTGPEHWNQEKPPSRTPHSTAFRNFLLVFIHCQANSSKTATMKGTPVGCQLSPPFLGLLHHPNPRMASLGPWSYVIWSGLAAFSIGAWIRCGHLSQSVSSPGIWVLNQGSPAVFGWLDLQYHLLPLSQ